MKKSAPVYSFAVTFTGKQAKAIEAVAKSKGITPEAMVRQSVRDALDRANGKEDENGLENYLLELIGNRSRLSTLTASQRQALEKRLASSLKKKNGSADEPVRKKTTRTPVKKTARTTTKKPTT